MTKNRYCLSPLFPVLLQPFLNYIPPNTTSYRATYVRFFSIEKTYRAVVFKLFRRNFFLFFSKFTKVVTTISH